MRRNGQSLSKPIHTRDAGKPINGDLVEKKSRGRPRKIQIGHGCIPCETSLPKEKQEIHNQHCDELHLRLLEREVFGLPIHQPGEKYSVGGSDDSDPSVVYRPLQSVIGSEHFNAVGHWFEIDYPEIDDWDLSGRLPKG